MGKRGVSYKEDRSKYNFGSSLCMKSSNANDDYK